MVPHSEYQPINAADKNDSDFLQNDLQQRLAKGPLQWDLIITVADAQDKSSDASIDLASGPADHQ